MPGESFRFIHASDFHLETPLGDLDSLPPHLHELMAEAPRQAARAVFEAALADNIDFLVLSGDLLNPQAAGPHGMSMLLDYFEQLNTKETPVFWCAGLSDAPEKWPESVPLPPNVTLFSKHETGVIPVQRGGRTICTVVGRSSDGQQVLHVPSYRVEATNDYTVAVGYGSSDADALAEGRFDYWALGGEHNHLEIEGGAEAASIYSGTPQGRSLSECGAHGYVSIDVDGDRTTRIHRIESDVFRYCNVKLDANAIAAVGDIRNLLGERIGRLQHENGGRHLLIEWDISIASGETLASVGDVEELLQWVRREYGHGSPAAWTTNLRIRPPKQYPDSWNGEDTILGDFLRASDKHGKLDGRDLNLHPTTEEHSGLNSTTTTLLAEVAASDRTDVLNQATLLGVEMLRGEKPNLVQKS